MESPLVRLSDVADWFIVDQRTAIRALERAGVRIIKISRKCRRVRRADFEKLKQTGIPYYADDLKRQ